MFIILYCTYLLVTYYSAGIKTRFIFEFNLAIKQNLFLMSCFYDKNVLCY